MATQAEIDAIIDALAAGPRSVSSPSGSVTNLSIADAIALDAHEGRKRITGSPFGSLGRATALGSRHYGT